MQIDEIRSALLARVEELAHAVVDAIWLEIDYYRVATGPSRSEVVASVEENMRFIFNGLSGTSFDTRVARELGARRAVQQVPLPAVLASYRIGCRQVWEAVVDESVLRPYLSREALVRISTRTWIAQDAFTEAMSDAYRERSAELVLTDAAERSAMVDALMEGRVVEKATVWEISQLLRLPTAADFVVVAADCPTLGRHAMPGIEAKLASSDIASSWRLLPDIQLGIVAIRNSEQSPILLRTLERAASAPVGVSPSFTDLRDTPDAVRYARLAMGTALDGESLVREFSDSSLALAAVSDPRIMRTVANRILAGFEDLDADDRDVLFATFRVWADEGGSARAAAKRLFCHVNTVRHRLQRIEKRSGRSVSRPRELAELCLAFEVDQQLLAPARQRAKDV